MIPHQYLDPCPFRDANGLDIPHPKYFVLYKLVASLINRYSKMIETTHSIPNNEAYTKAFIGTSLRERIGFRAPIDPINNVRWPGIASHNLFRPGRVWVEINIMDPGVTRAPYIRLNQIFELTLGPFQTKLAEGYISAVQV